MRAASRRRGSEVIERRQTARGRLRQAVMEPIESRVLLTAIISSTQAALLARQPQVVLTQATTLDADSVSVSYTISKNAVSQPLAFNFYRSDQPTLDSGSTLIGTQTISSADSTDSSIGKHDLAMIAGTSLPLDPAQEFVIVVADANGSVAEAAGSVNTAYFQTFVLGAISHGLESTGTTVPTWESEMATDLVSDDQYNDAIAFNWVQQSRELIPGQAVAAGNRLYSQVVQEADSLASAHSGDVVDLHFIGHSRGAVVISQAMQDLVGTTDPALQGSYIKATFLDAHPAGPSTFSLYSAAPAVAPIIAVAYPIVEAIYDDPQVVIPSNVKDAQVYYQHTSSADFKGGTDPSEDLLNLWGEGPSDGIINQSGTTVQYTNLTSPPGDTTNPIGHDQVPFYYLDNIIQAGDAASV